MRSQGLIAERQGISARAKPIVSCVGVGCIRNWAAPLQSKGAGKKKHHKHTLFGPNFPRTFLTLTPGCPGVKIFSPPPGPQETHFSVRMSMTGRVLEKLCPEKVCVDFWFIRERQSCRSQGSSDKYDPLLCFFGRTLAVAPSFPMVGHPPWYLVSHRHTCAVPHFATYRAIIVRYPEELCDTIATSILRYEKYRCLASISWDSQNYLAGFRVGATSSCKKNALFLSSQDMIWIVLFLQDSPYVCLLKPESEGRDF